MGIFSRKKKATTAPTPTTAESPAPSIAGPQLARVDSSHSSHSILAHHAPGPSSPAPSLLTPRLSLRVVLDPAPPNTESLFYIFVNPLDNVSAIRLAIAEKVGDVAMSLFKTVIPWQAHYQAEAYTEQYKLPVDLLVAFPGFNLDDSSQLAPSLGPSGWGGSSPVSEPTIGDWWPGGISTADQISVLARPVQGSSSSVKPLTFLAHIADAETSPARTACAMSPRVNRPARCPPPVIDMSPSRSVNDLKAAILERDGRVAGNVDDVALWQVEMSEEEMIVIEERGGLTGGKMPWPYPPTAPVPVMLENGNLPIAHYFPIAPNPRMISLSVWINLPPAPRTSDPSDAPLPLTRVLPSQADFAPPFRYPMVLSTPSPVSSSPASPLSPTTSVPAAGSPQLSSRTVTPSGTASPSPGGSVPFGSSSARRSKQRPSTAPAVVVSPSPSASPSASPIAPPHAFGSRSIRSRASPNLDTRPRIASPLSTSTIPPSSSHTTRGLGITASPRHSSPAGGARPSICSSASIDLSEDEGSVPSLTLSQLSLVTGEHQDYGLLTPTDEKSEWVVGDSGAGGHTDEMGRLKKSASVRLGPKGAMFRNGTKGFGDVGRAATLNAQIQR